MHEVPHTWCLHLRESSMVMVGWEQAETLGKEAVWALPWPPKAVDFLL